MQAHVAVDHQHDFVAGIDVKLRAIFAPARQTKASELPAPATARSRARRAPQARAARENRRRQSATWRVLTRAALPRAQWPGSTRISASPAAVASRPRRTALRRIRFRNGHGANGRGGASRQPLIVLVMHDFQAPSRCAGSSNASPANTKSNTPKAVLRGLEDDAAAKPKFPGVAGPLSARSACPW